jgi:hypothetical protein
MTATKSRTAKPTDRHVRKAQAQRRVGVGAQCNCDECRPAALIGGSDPLTCQRCKRLAEGKSTIDDHHVAGRANDPATIAIPTNDHVAILSEQQRDWPEQTLRNPDRDPFLKGAACIRGVRDTIVYLVDRVLLWIAHMLEAASALLTKTRGRFYWRNTPLEPFALSR